MAAPAADLAHNLGIVDAERQRRAAQPGLAEKVTALKTFQQRRFARTYADLLLSARYGAAARFFLDELYGPSDFTTRDAQFARVAPTIARAFPAAIAETVTLLAELHALSETLDTAMGLQLAHARITATDYIGAWQGVDRARDRERQIGLTLGIAAQLDRSTRLPLLRNALRLMRGPARAAGLSELQRTLETGFDTFRAMKGAAEFIALIGARERALAADLFAAAAPAPPAIPRWSGRWLPYRRRAPTPTDRFSGLACRLLAGRARPGVPHGALEPLPSALRMALLPFGARFGLDLVPAAAAVTVSDASA